MLGDFSLKHLTDKGDPAAVRQLRARLCGSANRLGADVIDAIAQSAASSRDAAALVALVHERLVDMSKAEMTRFADAVSDTHPIAAEHLRVMATQCEKAHPGPQRWGDVWATRWQQAGALDKAPSPAQALVREALRAGPLSQIVYPGCRLPPDGVRLDGAGAAAAQTMHIYRSLLLRPTLLAQVSFAADYARTGSAAAALTGASLRHGDAAWRQQLLTIVRDAPDTDLVTALLPHGELLRPLAEQGAAWVDWLVVLRSVWQAAPEVAIATFRACREAMGLEAALAWAACATAASCGAEGAGIASMLAKSPEAARDTTIEALLRAPKLRADLHARGVFASTWGARHRLSCLGAAMRLPDEAVDIYRGLRASESVHGCEAPEVALWLTCLSAGADRSDTADLLRLLEMGAAHLEALEKRHPKLRHRLLQRLNESSSESPLVNAFTDTTTQALVCTEPGRLVTRTRLQEASLKYLREALAEVRPARRVQRLFASASPDHAAALRHAISEDPEGLLWPLYEASLAQRHMLNTGLSLVDSTPAPLSEARHFFESFCTAGLPAMAVTHATHLALLVQKGARQTWSSVVQRLDHDALLLAIAGLGAHPDTGALEFGDDGWTLPYGLQRSAELAPQLWRVVQSEDGSHGKLTELVPHDTGRMARLLFDAPGLLRLAIDRLGQQPTGGVEGLCDDDDDDMPDLESVGDFLEVALRRVDALREGLPGLTQALHAQRLTDLSAKLPQNIDWSVLPESSVRRTAQVCLWLRAQGLKTATPKVVALRRREAVDHLRRRRAHYDALALSFEDKLLEPLHACARLPQVAPGLCADLGKVHGLGLMPLPGKKEALTFAAGGIVAPQNLHSLQEIHPHAHERDKMAFCARWSACVQAVLTDVTNEIAMWAKARGATPENLQQTLAEAFASYLSGFTGLPEPACRAFCERALPWGFMMPLLPNAPQDPVNGRALQLLADFSVLLRLTQT